jgi:hypothetical protein
MDEGIAEFLGATRIEESASPKLGRADHDVYGLVELDVGGNGS